MQETSATRDAASGTHPSAPADGHRRSVKQKVAHGTRKFLLMFVYLWVLFGLFALYDSMIRREMGLGYPIQGFAFINALVLAKVMMVAEELDLGYRMREQPLIYAILWEALLFTIVFIAFHVLERLVVGLVHGASLANSVPAIGGGGIAGLLTVAAIMFVVLIPYFAFRDIARKIGTREMTALLFSRPTRSDLPQR